MTSLLSSDISWAWFLLFLLVFGVLPGIALRVIVLAHPRDTGRREELIAELYIIPPMRRPLWVAQQLELALTEGVALRLARSPDSMARVALRFVFRSQLIHDEMIDALADLPPWRRPWWAVREGAHAVRYGTHRLESGVAMNDKYPDSFWIPDHGEKDAIGPGVHVKLLFRTRDDEWGERMWVRVERRRGNSVKGTLRNTPVGLPRIGAGDRITFTLDHVIDIDWPREDATA